MPAGIDTLHLRVGAVVAYECLLDEAAGTTSWRVGAVRALPRHTAAAEASDNDLHQVEEMNKEEEEEAEDQVMMGSASSTDPLTQPPAQQGRKAKLMSSLAVRNAPCHTVLIQPWISLAATPAPPTRDHQESPDHSHNVDSPVKEADRTSPSGSPSPRSQRAVSPAVRFAEIDAMQKELEEIQRFARDCSGEVDAEGAEKEEERLAKTLTQAYTRVLASTATMESSMAQTDDEKALSTSRSHNEADADPELTRRIDEKRREFRQRIEHLLSEMKETRQRQRDLQAAQANAETSLQNARLQLREAQEQVQNIDTRAMREIQSYRLPPAVVKLVMSAVLCVLGEKAATWPEVVTVMRTPGFLSRVALFDPAQLTQSRIQEVKKQYISSPHFSHEDAVKGSQALGQFHEWVMRQVQLLDADGDLSKFLAQKEASTAGLAATRRKMEADAAELKYLEEELDSLLHERVRRQQEQLGKSGSVSGMEATTNSGAGAAAPAPAPAPWPPLPSVRPITETAATTASPAEPQQEEEEEEAQDASAPTGRQSKVQKAYTDCTNGDQELTTSTRLRAAAAAAAAASTTTATHTWESINGITAEVVADGSATTPLRRPSTTTVAQQQQVLALIPPGSRWVCPPAGAVHSVYVLRSSILCVLGYTDDGGNEKDPGAEEEEEEADASVSTRAVWELSKEQQQFVCDALQLPLNDRPPAPLTEDEAAAEAARHTTVVSHHTVSFDGEEWAMVVEDSPEELRTAVVTDVAAICQVPNRAVTQVEWVLGSLHVDCDIEHVAGTTSTQLQQALEYGDYPTVMALYEGRQRVRDSLDEDATRQMQHANRIALMEDEIQAAQQAEADAKRELERVKEDFERQQHQLAEQVAVAQTSSQVDYLDEAREHLALREAMQDIQTALKERDAQLVRLQTRLQLAQREAATNAAAQQTVVKASHDAHAAAIQALQDAATTAAAEIEELKAKLAAAEQRAEAAESQARAAQEQVAAADLAHNEALREVESKAAEAAKQQAEAEAARHTTVVSHHTVSFDGEEWAMVVEDSPEELRTAVVTDVAAICQVPNRAVTQVEWVLGSLHVDCDIEHVAGTTSTQLQQALEYGDYPTVMALYEGRQERRAELQAKAEAAAQEQQRLSDLEAQLRDATAAQAALQRTLQAIEMTRTAALERAQVEQQQALQAAAEKADQTIADLTRQLQATQAALEAEAQQHQQELAAAQAREAAVDTSVDRQAALEQQLAAAQQEAEDAQQQLRVANDVLKKLEVQSRRDAREAEKRAKDAAQAAQTQRAVDAKEAEKATAAVERKLRAAQAALQEQVKLHHTEVEKLLAQLSESEAARQQLCDARVSAQAAEQQRLAAEQEADAARAALAGAQQRAADAHAGFVQALQAQLRATDGAAASCAMARQQHADAADDAEKRRGERRAALEDVCERVKMLAQEAANFKSVEHDTEQLQQHQMQANAAKASVARDLADLLNDMKKDKEAADAAVAHSRGTTADLQSDAATAQATVEAREAELAEAQAELRRLEEEAVEGGEKEGEEDGAKDAAVEDLQAQVTASLQGFAAAAGELSAAEERRLAVCAAEAAAVAQLLQSVETSTNVGVAQCMREVHTLATTTFLQRHQTAWMNTCLCGLLATAVLTLQYKKYAV